ncbi:MAG: GntR family transcriptional regulator [Candidatus Aminicenantes bacterium]|nr:GntR family transcriptional regulator [Candidatus Aminicenantes bacterium]
MSAKSVLNLTSLKEQVYHYLRDQMQKGKIKPGSVIKMESTCQKLGISKTPLRDALIQLEMEGFVTILPRQGVYVNRLELQDIKEYYQVIGALENKALLEASGKMGKPDIKRMEKLTLEMRSALKRDNFDLYYKKNLKFHDVFLQLCGNKILKKTVDMLKKRLYDFPRLKSYVKEWEESSIEEHLYLIGFLFEGKFKEAARYIRDVHWSFEVQEKYIKRYYFHDEEKQKIRD